MSDSDRREFLKRSSAAAAMLGIAGPAGGIVGGSQTDTLRAIGAAVLPTADLGDEEVDRVVADFEAWIDGFEPIAEQPHAYLNRGLSEIRYGPAHPGPRWSAQIEALELLAERRHRAAFAELSIDDRRALIEGELERDELGRMPTPATARHVVIGLMAFFYAGSEATDLCYRASIGRFRCRGLSGLGREPRPLAATPDARRPFTPASGTVDEGS